MPLSKAQRGLSRIPAAGAGSEIELLPVRQVQTRSHPEVWKLYFLMIFAGFPTATL